MMIHTTKQICDEWQYNESYKDYIDRISNDKREWICLSDLKKEITAMAEKHLSCTCEDKEMHASIIAGLNLVYVKLCNSSEQKRNTEDNSSDVQSLSSVSGEHNTQKKCTCQPKPKRGGMGVEVHCGRCGGAL
jgi:hypothetical protein